MQQKMEYPEPLLKLKTKNYSSILFVASDLTNVPTKLAHTNKTSISFYTKQQAACLTHSLTSTANGNIKYTQYVYNTSKLFTSVLQRTSVMIFAKLIHVLAPILLKSLQTYTHPSKFSFASSRTAVSKH
jgi:hypothetical protein